MAELSEPLDLELDDVEPIADETVEPIEGEAVADEGDEFAIELEGEEEVEEAPLVKTLRQVTRDQARELSEYRKASLPKIEVGEEPTLESSDYDEDRFKTDWLAWNGRKTAAANQEHEAAERAQVVNQQNQRRFNEYRAAAALLPVKAGEFEAAEKAVIAALPETPDRPFQQVLLHYTKDPAKLVLALAKYPAKLEALAQETDPIRLAITLNDLEKGLKVTTRRKPPPPESETIQRGSAAMSQSSDKEADRLLTKAANGGSMQDYYNHMKRKRA